MTALRKRWVWCLIGVAVGFVIGGVAGIMRAQIMFRPAVELFRIQPFGSASSSALTDLRALKKLRGGNADDAIEILETDLEGNCSGSPHMNLFRQTVEFNQSITCSAERPHTGNSILDRREAGPTVRPSMPPWPRPSLLARRAVPVRVPPNNRWRGPALRWWLGAAGAGAHCAPAALCRSAGRPLNFTVR